MNDFFDSFKLCYEVRRKPVLMIIISSKPQIDRASATETVDSGSIPGRVKP